MNNILTEKDYQSELLGILRDQNGYTIRKAKDFDRAFAVDREMMFGFLNDTQPETMEKLRKIHKDRLEDTIVSFINAECTKKRGSLLEVLRHGVELSGNKLELMFTKPAIHCSVFMVRLLISFRHSGRLICGFLVSQLTATGILVTIYRAFSPIS